MFRFLVLALALTASALHSPSLEEVQQFEEVDQEEAVIEDADEDDGEDTALDVEEDGDDESEDSLIEEAEEAEEDDAEENSDDVMENSDDDEEEEAVETTEDDEEEHDEDEAESLLEETEDSEEEPESDDEVEEDAGDAELAEDDADAEGDDDDADESDDEDDEDSAEDEDEGDAEDDAEDDEDAENSDEDAEDDEDEAADKSPTMVDEADEEQDENEGFEFTADMPLQKGPTDQASVFAKAKAAGKPAMVLATKSWCPHCQDLAESMNADPSMKTLMSKFVAFHAPDDQGEAWHGDTGYVPRAFFYNKDGQQIDVHSPYAQYPYFFDNSQVLQAGMKKALSQA